MVGMFLSPTEKALSHEAEAGIDTQGIYDCEFCVCRLCLKFAMVLDIVLVFFGEHEQHSNKAAAPHSSI